MNNIGLVQFSDLVYDLMANNTDNDQFSVDMVEDMCVDVLRMRIVVKLKPEFGGRKYQLKIEEIEEGEYGY